MNEQMNERTNNMRRRKLAQSNAHYLKGFLWPSKCIKNIQHIFKVISKMLFIQYLLCPYRWDNAAWAGFKPVKTQFVLEHAQDLVNILRQNQEFCFILYIFGRAGTTCKHKILSVLEGKVVETYKGHSFLSRLILGPIISTIPNQ